MRIGQELGDVEVPLGEVVHIGCVNHHSAQGGGASQPASVTAHDFDHGDHPGMVHPAILVYLGAGGGDILGGGGEAGAVVGVDQVLVDSIGHAHHPALITRLGHEADHLGAGVQGIVAAV